MTATAVRRLRTALDEQLSALGEPPFTGDDEEAVRACAEAVVRAERPLRPAVKAAVRGTLAVLSERAPGGALEVRVPPYGAVQAVEGPRHTRGTPPGVVETDPSTWLRLVIGVADWAQEVSEYRVRASVDGLVLMAGVAREGIDFEALDGEPVHLFFLLVGPESGAGQHVKALSRISRLLRRESFRQRLIDAPDAKAFYSVLAEAEAS